MTAAPDVNSLEHQDLTDEPWREIPSEEAQWMRPAIPSVLKIMVEGVRRLVPEYARPGDHVYQQTVELAVSHAMTHFVQLIADPDASWKDVHQVYFDVGYGEAVEGRGLEHLQNAMRISSRIAWRHLSVEAGRLGKSRELTALLAEANFAFLDELASAAAHGYARAREKQAGEREQRRGRLLTLLLSDPPATPDVLNEQAVLAGWPLPQRLAVVILIPRTGSGGEGPAGLAPHLLSGLDHGRPCVVVPDPEGPGRADQLTTMFAGWTGAMGPAVPVDQAGTSLLWARRTLELVASGVISGRSTRKAGFLARAEEHLPRLLLHEGGTLAELAAGRRLAALDRAGPKHGMRLAVTLLECMKNGFNATGASTALCVHPQTVRYRLAQLQEIFDFDFEDPEIRLEMMLLLQVWIQRAQAS
ncbi:helix-turn-helix domain-containing protein [Actinocorallia longicatena]|uniref:PucR family transcriptional regulator n=1 Tax=Actinocorallia longicatena TaxID=111803 RepID=A0ABP6QD76_9ACTN